MAKAILEFDLSEQEDEEAHKRAVKSLDLALALWDIENYIRRELKYNENMSEEAYNALEKFKDEYYSILSNYNISLNELMS